MTVLGKSPALPDANGANSGYLISHEGYTVLLDCGSGVFAKLRALGDPADVDAVLITHMHADHTLDVFTFSHALTYHGAPDRRPPLWAPPGGERIFTSVCDALSMEDQVAQAFELTEYEPERELELGPFTVRFAEVPHYIPAWACDLKSSDDRRLTFGADCGPNDAIVSLGRDTDLLMLEATEGYEPDLRPAFRGHMSAHDAGELARRANAARLVLTHYSDQLDPDALRKVAEQAFGAPVELAAEGGRHVI